MEVLFGRHTAGLMAGELSRHGFQPSAALTAADSALGTPGGPAFLLGFREDIMGSWASIVRTIVQVRRRGW
jgi:hypothetical protein